MSLKITQFGNQILRNKTRLMSNSEILSIETRTLITEMKSLLIDKKLGIGIAANQVGESVALVVIEIQKTPIRNTIEEVSLVIINPFITQVFGRRPQMWEGCISSGAGKAGLFGKVPRHKSVELEYLDENAVKHKKIFKGFTAHVIQHEVDHLNGILFVDKVKDTKSYMTYAEYKKMQKNK